MTNQEEPIAVIGMSCRFPGGSSSPSKLWDLLRAPKDIAKPVPADRFDAEGFWHANGSHHGATDCREAYFLDEDVTRFDNAFFNVQAGEAEALDPQQRFLMETIYDSLVSAGQTIESLRGSRAACYVGLMCDDWSQMNSRDWDLVPTYAATGTSRAVVSNRVSYFFDWHGPSMTIDTACSSSLVAVHEGVHALRRGDAPIVVAAGANLILSPGMMIAESNLHMLSPTGRSKMWDAAADGYARGEGIAAVVLKPLSAALRDGDPIHCLVRGTGVNQDGRTPGLTMPNNVAQADLIRDTYARAGLNISDPKDRPQFFHAHGTGTPAGDPQEAEAISKAFYGESEEHEPLFVGSIKTVIGHTEGTAGLASLIGTAVAMQHGTIPPNLHFKNISPRVAEFCGRLKVPTEAVAWPEVDGRRRASVNSFGFGGTNAHAILESYTPATPTTTTSPPKSNTPFTPLTLSAASPSALRRTLTDLYSFLSSPENDKEVNLRDLIYTHTTRRSTLPFRKSIPIPSLSSLLSTLASLTDASAVDSENGLTTRYFDVTSPSILGVFTGQGAQWTRMAAHLLESSQFVADRVAELDAALTSLPSADRPTWTLKGQILAAAEESKVGEAAVSQPLCTAVQIVLVDLLRQAGIEFKAVVGHSSGEIGAAYAAGFLNAVDAVRVAYYRGLYAKLAGSDSQKGAMLAVGTSYEDAAEFVALEEFEGRIQVAARNSATSVTLSGDADAIDEAAEIFQDEGRFARKLKVDTAYHSHHMLPCAEPYRTALEACDIKVGEGNGTVWYSSVLEERVITREDVTPQYWVDNMTSAVLFAPAVANALQAAESPANAFDIAVEVGPHPALKSPALDTIEEVAGHRIPYTGVLARGKNDTLEFSAALGYLWTHLGAGSVNFDAVEQTLSGDSSPKKVLTNLPTYPFDHSRSFYALTRFTGAHRNTHAPPNPILGRRCVESETADAISWRNILKSGEISWLPGHQLQGQTVFPAMGYVAMAVEAGAVLASDANRPLGLVTLEDVVIGRALAFTNDSAGMEARVTVRIDTSTADSITGHISVHSGLPFDGAPLALNYAATLRLALHDPAPDTLPAVRADEINLVKTDPARLYSQFTQLGYNYSPPFTGVTAIQRKRGFATGIIEDISGDSWEDQLIVHPGWLDFALQTAFAAYSYPHDNRLWSLHVPTEIKSLSVNPYFRGAKTLHYQSTAREGLGTPVAADIDLFASETDTSAFVQLEAVQVKPFAAATPRDDALLFARFVYRLAAPDAVLAVGEDDLLPPATEAVVAVIERLGFYYLRRVHETITPAERDSALPHFRHLIDLCGRVVPWVASGQHPHVPKEAINDSAGYVNALVEKYHDRADIRLLQAVGDNLVPEIRRDGIMLEHMMKDGILDRFYEELAGLDVANVWIGRMVAQVAHRHPGLKIFEIGAGTGGTTRSVLPALEGSFNSYTFTDVSAGFFGSAQERFRQWVDRMVFATYDMEKSPEEQGFEEGGYDVVLASNVLHATGRLDDMMANTRKLLRPGGYLMMLEFVSNDRTGITACMGGLPGWWGNGVYDPARGDGPCLTPAQWDGLVRKHGFAGVDTHTPIGPHLQWYTVHLCQAVDDRVLALRNPLGALGTLTLTPETSDTLTLAPETIPETPLSTLAPPPPELVIVGGTTPGVASLVSQIQTLLTPRYSITTLPTLEELHTRGIAIGSSVLSLTELDTQFFEHRTAAKLDALKSLWRTAGSILWVTRGVRDASPYSAMILGLARVVRFENPSINLQILDFAAHTGEVDTPTAEVIASDLLRLEMGRYWKEENVNILWSVEPEAHYENGTLMIPRMYPDREANARYNTQRRTVSEVVNPKEVSVALEPSPTNNTGLELVTPSPLRLAPADDLIELAVSHSVLHAVHIPGAGFFTLAAGINTETTKPTLTLSAGPVESKLQVPVEWTLPLKEPVTPAVLADIAAHLAAKSLLQAAPAFGSLLVHDPPTVLREALDKEAVRHGAHVVFSTSQLREDDSSEWTVIPAKLPTRLVQKLVPGDISAFANLADPADEAAQASAALITRVLPAYTPTTTVRDVLRPEAGAVPEPVVDITTSLRDAWSAASKKRRGLGSGVDNNTISLSDLSAAQPGETTPLSVVSWSDKSVLSNLRPVDAGQIFRPDGTYLMFGLSGEVGQSLCAWMVAHGARHVVLSSRNPKLHPRYVAGLAAQGADVRALPLDLTNREAVRKAVGEIRRSMPEVIGVANGALLLEDALFDGVVFETLQRTAAPKVEGSAYLDELFYDTPLDFFILFTSVANITGNTGQSAYVIANQFMTALAAQRRDRRGVPGSTIAISSVQGLGYLEHSDIDKDRLVRWGYRNISEQDLHILFAEAVLAGRPGAAGIGEVVTSMSPFRDTVEIQPNLRLDPKFRHYLIQDGGGSASAAGAGAGSKAIRPRARLAGATSQAEVVEIVQESLTENLKRILMMPASEEIDPLLSLVELGIDSIMAVDLRTWFLKELDVDVPVLKILSPGETVRSLGEEALGKIPAELVDFANLAEVSDKSAEEKPVVEKVDKPVEKPVEKAVESESDSDTNTTPNTLASSPALLSTPGTPATTVDDFKFVPPAPPAPTSAVSVSDLPQITEAMTFGQRRFWFLSHYVDDPTTFNIAYLARLTGRLRLSDLSRAVQSAAQRHETLRTRFFWSADDTRTPMQGILPHTFIRLETATIETEAQAQAELEAMRTFHWDLGNGVPLRIKVLSLSETSHFLLLGSHHISMDGHSFSVFLLDIHQAYTSPPHRPLPPLPESSQARAFGAAQLAAHSSGALNAAINHYKTVLPAADLARPIALLPLAKVSVRPPLDRYATHVARTHLDATTTAQLKALARSQRATSFHAYLATLQALLFRLLPADTTPRVYIGIADANRLDAKFQAAVGNFLNVLPLRFDRGSADQTVGEAVQTARDTARTALLHSALPFDLLLDELAVPRSNSWAPVFQVFLNYRLVVAEHAEKRWVGARIGEETWHTARTGYDVALEIVEDQGGAMLAVHVQRGLYDEEGAGVLVRSFANAVKEIAKKGAGVKTGGLPKWDGADVKRALEVGMGPSLSLTWPSVTHQIDSIIAANPTAIALKDGTSVLTYADLDTRANTIAHALLSTLSASKSESADPIASKTVGVFQTPSVNWIVSLLAIHRANAIYLPLDLRNSIPRLKSNVAVAKPAVLLVDSQTAGQVSQLDAPATTAVINVSSLPETSQKVPTTTVKNSPAYIIFTSGSTGLPKGILVTHAGLAANLEGYHRAWSIPSLASVVLQQASFGFDASLLQIYAALTTGGTLLVVPAEARGDPAEVVKLMREHGVSMTQATPSEYDMWLRFAPEELRRCTEWKAAWFGGERAAPGLVERFRALSHQLPNLEVYTSYGPTESTISAMKGRADVRNDLELTVPVPGRLLPNYAAYLVDDEMNPLPVGVPGEILLGGAGVGENEYLGREDLTEKAFLPNPFPVPSTAKTAGGKQRLYRTGDYGRLDKSGFLAIEGRIAGDTQVKLRGFRIELVEIERVILRESEGKIAQVVVTVRGAEDEDAFLAAHIVLDPEHASSSAPALIDRLHARLPLSLPQYMCPAVIVALDTLPLTSNAKVDRRAVQALAIPESATSTSADTATETQPSRPLTSTETRLARLWAAVLPRAGAIGPRSDFFLAGGNSLLLVKLQASIKKEFGDSPRLSKLMSATELASMAALLDDAAGAWEWEKEATADVPVSASSGSVRTTGLHVLVTGATGSLGQRVVKHLASDPAVSALTLLLRATETRPDPTTAFSSLATTTKTKITILPVDLTTDLPSILATLSNTKVDIILHSAADRSFWDGYPSLRPVNVTALKHLTALAARTNASLHTLSSGALAAFDSDSASETRPDRADGYLASKWIAERYLTNTAAAAASKGGVRVTAHRPTAASGGVDGDGKETLDKLARDMLRLSVELGVRPDYARLSGSFDVGVLESVASSLAHNIIQGQSDPQGARLKKVTYPGQARVEIPALAARAEELLAAGGEEAEGVKGLPTVGALHWVGLAKKAGLFEWLLTAQELVVEDEEGRRVVSRR
ncbi:Nonribosomal peptide synthetase-like protein [Dichotomopilus funicola]|uniref:Nonribosomal peptide synthetase-like protein n=1 Tax=Dichotomopilus funicola TaxID=1934379 RepID=A0AAN6UY18_9PEZI|nr:Nonribosomal peptide synthetase-like protein [Dichotomopilus funicola]